MGRGEAQAAAAAVPSSIPSSASSGGLASSRRFISKIKLTRLPYHRLDEIHEEEEIAGDDPVDLFQSYIEEEEEEEEEQEQGGGVSRAQLHQRPRKRRMFSRSSSSSNSATMRAPLRVGSAGYHARRRNRWRRMRLRICSRVRWSWLSPLEFLKKLRRAYIQAMISLSAKESQCGIVLLGSPWSFPVVVPFRNGIC